MAFPTVESTVEASFSSATTTHNVTLMATINDDDKLIACVSMKGSGSHPTNNTPSGWTQVHDAESSGNAYRFTIFEKLADGTEGGATVDFSTSVSARGAVQVWRITGHNDAEEGTNANSSGSSPNPPSHTASWGSDDNLWIPWLGSMDDDGSVSAYPSNYNDNQLNTLAGGGTNASAAIGSCSREVAAATEDPGAYTLSEAELSRMFTMAVQPGSLPAAASGNPWHAYAQQ